MNEKNIKETVLTSLVWKLMERTGVQGVQFVVQMILARILLPKDYGVIALITIFIAVANVFVQNGFNTALIQKKDADEIDFSSVFYLSLGVAGILYIILFFSAPHIADFYNEVQLIPVVRVLSLTLFFGAVNSIQSAVIARKMQFKKYFFSSIVSVFLSGAIGIVMAYKRYGVWALVIQQLTNIISVTIILWFTVKWRPKLLFSLDRLKELFSYGWKLLCSSLIDVVYQEMYSLVIGKVYNSKTLGYFSRGEQFPKLIVSNINGSIQSVMLPILSESQDDKARIKSMVRRSIVTSSFIIFPMMVGLAICADQIIIILLTEKWLPCVPFLQIMCISYALWPIHTANLQAINALGRSDIFLKLEIIKKGIGVLGLVISIPFGIYTMVSLKALTSIISSFVNAYPNRKLLGYSYKEQIEDIIPSVILSIIMGVIIYGIKFIGLGNGVILIIQITLGIVIYIGLAYLAKLECCIYIIDSIRNIIKR